MIILRFLWGKLKQVIDRLLCILFVGALFLFFFPFMLYEWVDDWLDPDEKTARRNRNELKDF